jgi:D-amino peptidase
MNIFISADIEGVCGVVGAVHWRPDGALYAKACEWMTAEVSAAVEGALAGGAKKVVVKDSHNDGTNIQLDLLHPKAELISGWGPLNSMAEGVDSSYAALFLIGYHPRAITLDGTLAHVWNSNLLELRLNGQPIGEAAWAAAFAGHFNVPLGLVTGDDKLIAQLSAEMPTGWQSVLTKTGWAFNAAQNRPLGIVREEIKAAAERAVRSLKSLPVYRPTLPATVRMRFRHWEGLAACEAMPNVERVAPDAFEFRAKDIIEAQKYFSTMNKLARYTIQ